ncbi:MAG: NADH-quinone oxidoreductase subunit N [Bacteroidota bacterium]|jgi:NADH-quinone oxidoreductase subunit N
MEFFTTTDLIGSSPVLTIGLFSLIAIVVNAVMKQSQKIIFAICAVGMAGAMGFAMYLFPVNETAFSDMLLVGGYSSFYDVLFLGIGIASMVLALPYLEKEQYHYGEYYILVTLSVLGMMLMGSAGDLITIFLGLEVMSVSFYVLAGYFRSKLSSNESSLKYFLLGAFATGFLLYGIALIYGTTGTTNLLRIAAQYPQSFSDPLHLIGWGLILIGFGFKVAAVPFHMWVPDVYEGAPTSVTALMSTGGKAAAFSAFILSFSIPMSMHDEKLIFVISVLAAASMIIGNWIGLSQTNLKRMLAYSSIAHAGYMLIGIASGIPLGQQGISFYLVSYALTNLGAFGVIAMMEKEGGTNLSYEDYTGLARRSPALAALLSMFMFSLTGIPPFSGFVGKYYLFASAVESHLTWLAILGVVTSLFSTYYYLRVVVYMYFKEPIDTSAPAVSRMSFWLVVISGIGILVLGIFPSIILDLLKTIF